MQLRRTALVATVATLAAALLTGVAPALADLDPVPPPSVGPPTEPECLPLGAGTTGVLLVGGQVPSGDQLSGQAGGLGAPVTGDLGRTLPDRVVFKDSRHTFSNDYAFALRQGRIYVRPAKVGVGRPGEPWRRLELPTCLDGRVQEISADHSLLIALGPGRQVYSHDMAASGDLSAERWTWRWGPYFWTGSGMRLYGDVRAWATSEFTSAERLRDSAGRTHSPIGVATVYLLRGDRRRITYLDPWLPQDESREVCGPERGTLPLTGLSGSGSTVFVVGAGGELFTRLYDFDVSGANTVFGDFTWERGLPADDPRWQLPGPTWVRQPEPPGRVTDRISIAKTGSHADQRLLTVEGRDASGRRGYWRKTLTAERWTFVRTGAPLQGRLLPTRADRRFVADDRRYVGTVGERRAVVADFNPECSPARLSVQVAPGQRLDLLLHSSDGLRQERRDRGLTDVPREYNGAVEVPWQTWRQLASQPAAVRRWVATHLDGRFTTAPLAVTSTRVRFLDQCWQLTLDGEPARPDEPALPPDAGAVVGRLTELQGDGRAPSTCLP
ncbi:hypothetical protein NSZ01_11350 [Nocardioides szechwanensis]|uniref:Tachylectin n=1 Tax=Nocardioides szechwanensis TaxID=1005944 RepID=A0A1H0CPR2_9ACTN|nr:hypothetical protein [Nocardioides szechwanensis]GEP33367.1 hypothetical protein NSZ01_11350 [Nocardioides szechwanensis]SDN59897.1 hypothetical protein SAMN05192576_2490 [Nocardioides szechwanensis]